MSNDFAMSWRVQVSFSFDDDVRFALDQRTYTYTVVRICNGNLLLLNQARNIYEQEERHVSLESGYRVSV
jgi:hypothetical protein